ncbi:Hpt domain-containing protein [Nitrospinota bacterium]
MAKIDPNKSESLNSAIAALRREYISRWPEKYNRFEELFRDFVENNQSMEILKDLRMEFHRLAGSGGSYGLPAVSEVGHEAEIYIDSLLISGEGASPEAGERIQEFIRALDKIFKDAM